MIRRLVQPALPACLFAAPPAAEPSLPPKEAVASALLDHPSVIAARACADATRKGPYEFTAQGSYVRRDGNGGAAFDEFDAQWSRPVRLPGKARLNREIDAQAIIVAENGAKDARHEAALLLAAHWFDWLSASAQAEFDRAAVGNYEAALAAIKRRRDMRDAAQLDVDQAEAALAEARRTLEQSAGLAAMARTRLQTQFPSLALPVDALEVPLPELAHARLSQLGELVIGNSHRLAAAEAESARMAAVAERARADRVADPTVGLRLVSEFGGIERGAGVFISMPLGGGHRKALASEAGAGASAAQADAQLARYEVSEVASSDVTEVRFRRAI